MLNDLLCRGPNRSAIIGSSPSLKEVIIQNDAGGKWPDDLMTGIVIGFASFSHFFCKEMPKFTDNTIREDLK